MEITRRGRKWNEALRPKSSTTNHGVDLSSGRGESPDQFQKVEEVHLVHRVHLPETNLGHARDVAEDAITGLAHAVDVREAAAEDATTGLVHVVDLLDTITEDVAATEHVLAQPGSKTQIKTRTKCWIVMSPSCFQTMRRPQPVTLYKFVTRQRNFWRSAVTPYHTLEEGSPQHEPQR